VNLEKQHWSIHRLKFVADLNMGQSPPSEVVNRSDGEHDFPFLQGNAEFGNEFPLPVHVCADPPKVAKKGDLLISVRAPVGALNVADQDFGIGRGLCAISWDNLYPRFGWWAMHHQRIQLDLNATGSTYVAVSTEDVANVRLSFPTHDFQKKISNYLDRETAHIDALIAEKERMLALLEEKRAALISQAVTRGLDPDVPLKPSGLDWLGDIPAHWDTSQLRFGCFSFQTGPFGSQLHAEEYVDNGIPVINPANLKDNRINPDFSVSVDEGTAERLSVHKLQEDDVVFARRGELGRCGVVEADQVGWLCGTGSLRVWCDKLITNPAYLALVFNSTLAAKALTLESVGSTMDNLNTEMLSHFQVPMPPIDEQQHIISKLESSTIDIRDLMDVLDESIALLKERRSALITAAVTGQLTQEDMAA